MGDRLDEVAPPVTRGGPRLRWATVCYFAFFGAYLGGLVLWLSLGLLPTITFAIPALTRDATSLAAETGPLSGLADAVISNRAMLPGPGAVTVDYLFSMLNLALGVLITVRRPFGLVPRLLALAFLGTAATFNAASHVVFHLLEHAPLITAAHFTFHVVSGVAYIWAVMLFPGDSRDRPDLPAPRQRLLLAAGVAGTALVIWICYRSSFIAHPPFFVAFFGILVPIVGITAQTVRLASPRTDPVSRQQSKLLRISLVPALLVAILWLTAQALERFGPFPGSRAADWVDVTQSWFPAVFAVVPVMLFVAMVRYRLWDIDLVVSRTLLLMLLLLAVLAMYGATLAMTGWIFRNQSWASLVAVIAVAMAVEPVRARCARLANRIVFGTTLTPRESMRQLAERLTATSSSTNELAELTDLVVAGTRAREASVWLVMPGKLVEIAASPHQAEPDTLRLSLNGVTIDDCRAVLPGRLCLPVRHEKRLLAVLTLTLPPKVSLPRSEKRLVGSLADHAGLIVANATLTTELAREVALVTARAGELLTARQRLVAAQDDERQQLERDIHDGAQQELVAAILTVRAAARATPEPIRRTVSDIAEATALARETIEEVCRAGVPRVLAESGLPAALQAVADATRRTGVSVDVTCDLPGRLPSDVEAALFFCCREATQNASKHARADRLSIEVAAHEGEVVLRVHDDGRGFEASRVTPGSGLTNLLTRMAVVGGTALIESSPGRGATMICRVTVAESEMSGGRT